MTARHAFIVPQGQIKFFGIEKGALWYEEPLVYGQVYLV